MAWDSRPLSGGRCVEPLAWGPERGRKGAASIALSAPHVRGAPGAKSFVDDLILGQGFVSSRAATSLRSIESHPLSQAFVSPSGAAWAPAHAFLHHTQGWVPLPPGRREGRGGGSAGLREAASTTCPCGTGASPSRPCPTGERGWGPHSICRSAGRPDGSGRPGSSPSPLLLPGKPKRGGEQRQSPGKEHPKRLPRSAPTTLAGWNCEGDWVRRPPGPSGCWVAPGHLVAWLRDQMALRAG